MPFQNEFSIWASEGTSVMPSDSKITQGWIREKPPFEYQNWWQERADGLLYEFNRGRARWAESFSDTDYTGSSSTDFTRAVIASENSWVGGSSGVIIASQGLQTNSENCLSMGYGASLSTANLTVELDAVTGDAYFAGAVSATDVSTQDLDISGEAVFSGSNFSIMGEVNFEMGSTLNVSGNTTFNSGVTFEDDITFASLGSPGISGELNVYGDVIANAVFVGADEVWHPGNTSTTIENLMDSSTQSQARQALGIETNSDTTTVSNDGGGTWLDSWNISMTRVGSMVFARFYVRDLGDSGNGGSTLTQFNQIPSDWRPISQGDTGTLLVSVNNHSSTVYLKAIVYDDGAIVIARQGDVGGGSFTGALAWRSPIP